MSIPQTRLEYKHFTPPESIPITGDIFPVRDKRNDGSDAIMRGEDMAFLIEAACVISYARGLALLPPELDTTRSHDVLKWVNERLRDSAHFWVQTGTTVPSTFDGGPTENLNNSYLYPSFSSYSMTDESISEYKESPELTKYIIKDEFANLLKFGLVQCALPATMFFDYAHEWTARDAYGNDVANAYTETGLKNTLYDYSYLKENTIIDGTRRAIITTGTLTFIIPDFSKYYSRPQIWGIFKVEKATTATDAKTWAVAQRLDNPISSYGEKFSINEGTVLSALSRIRGKYGLYDEPAAGSVRTHYNIEIIGSMILCEPLPHTRLDDLEWNPS